MKKILALLMAMIMLLSLAACGGSKDKKDGDDGTTAASEQKHNASARKINRNFLVFTCFTPLFRRAKYHPSICF